MRIATFVLVMACDPSHAPIDYVVVEEGCLHTAGELTTRDCCEGTLDYPDTCGEDVCTCSREASWSVLYCECGVDRCFDGAACILPDWE